MTDPEAETLAEVRERGAIDGAGTQCTYCRETKPDCRPVCVEGRDHIPALCDGCYVSLREADRLDDAREKEVFFP